MFTGIALKVAATFVFAAMSAMIKIVSPVFPVGEVVLFRSLFALAVLAAWLASRGEFPRALHAAQARPHRALDRRFGRHVRQFRRAVAAAARRRHRLHPSPRR
jgi:EamA domain-containing membrane protein RarD